MGYVKVTELSEHEPGSKMKVSLEGTDIFLTNIKGEVYAVQNRCPHMGGSLVNGTLKGSHITCPLHGSVFDVMSGEVIKPGKLLFMNVRVHDLQTFPVKVEGNDVFVEQPS